MSKGPDDPGDVEDSGNAGSIVLGPGGWMPRVKMGADNDNLLGKLAAGDLCDDIINLRRGSNAILEGELDSDWTLIEQPLDEQFIFKPDLRIGIPGDRAVESEGRGGFDAIGAAHNEQRLRSEFV